MWKSCGKEMIHLEKSHVKKLSHEKLILKKKKLEENKWTCGECENESCEKKLILGENACENINIILKK